MFVRARDDLGIARVRSGLGTSEVHSCEALVARPACLSDAAVARSARRRASWWAGLVLLGSGGAFLAGCVDNEQSIFIQQVSAPPEGGSCTITTDAQGLFLGNGTLDVAFRVTYEATLLVGNQLAERGSRQQVRTESNRVAMEGSEVFAVDNGTGEVVFGPNTVPGSGFIDPSAGTDPSYGLLGTVLFLGSASSGLVAQLRSGQLAGASITSHVRVFGHTLGGTSVESGEFLFPITLCNGCLVTFPTDATDTTKTTPNCDLAASTGTTLTAPCIPGQDDVVDCRVCKQYLGSSKVCDPT